MFQKDTFKNKFNLILCTCYKNPTFQHKTKHNKIVVKMMKNLCIPPIALQGMLFSILGLQFIFKSACLREHPVIPGCTIN